MPTTPSSPPTLLSRRRLLTTAASAALAGAALAARPARATATPTRAAAPVMPAVGGHTVSGDTVRGILERVSVEQEQGSTRSTGFTVWVRTGDQHVPIDPGPVAALPTGSAVTVQLGPPAGPHSPRRILSLTVGGRSAARAEPSLTGAGTHTVTVVLGLPAGVRADSMTTKQLTTAVDDAARYWSRQSDGRITFEVGRAVGWLQLTPSGSDVWGLWDEAGQRSGFVPGPRRHLLLYVPAAAGCPSGLGTVSPSASDGGYALVGSDMTSLIAHELGHNLGLGHSDELSCTGASDGTFTAGRWVTGCTHQAYGDWYDVMGISWQNVGSLNTGHAYQLGLLGPGSVLSTADPVRAVLRPVSGRAGLRSLRVTDRDGAVYVVEYRPATGDDAWIATSADWRGLQGGVLIRRIDPQDPTRTLLLDASPTPGGPAGTDWDFALTAGQSLTTASGRVTIRVESQVATAATVVVSVDGVQPGSLAAPTGRLINGSQVTIRDAPSATASPGR